MAAAKMLRAEFERLTHAGRATFIREGGRLVDNPAEATATASTAEPPPPTITRARFDALPIEEQHRHVRERGGVLVDSPEPVLVPLVDKLAAVVSMRVDLEARTLAGEPIAPEATAAVEAAIRAAEADLLRARRDVG